MIKHVAPNNVLSHFNPIVSLKPAMKRLVNDHFFMVIAEQFFSNKGGIDQFQPLDMDKIKTEIDFDRELNFVNRYLYKEIIETISKEENGTVHFTPKYVFTFDRDLAPHTSDLVYPYSRLLETDEGSPEHIRYGCMRLGNAPVLFYIWIDIQRLIQFIKQYPSAVDWENPDELSTPSRKQKSTAYQIALSEIQLEKASTSDSDRLRILEEQEELLQRRTQRPEMPLVGKSGILRINLQWDTTDDLDLHVWDPDRHEICFSSKSAICQGKRGELDVDANAGEPFTSHPQENIVWEFAPEGKFEVQVTLYTKRDVWEKIPFTVKILPNESQGRIYSGFVTEAEPVINIASFEFTEGTGVHEVTKLF